MQGLWGERSGMVGRPDQARVPSLVTGAPGRAGPWLLAGGAEFIIGA